MMRILAVVVTHNRKTLLKRCLDNLKLQSRQPDDILVIDNGSSDGTQAFLDANNIQYIKQENLGSAGGWYCGINYGLKNNYDLCWLMDDDGFPEKNSLNLLEEKYDKKYSCLSSLVVDEKMKKKLVFPMPILNKNGFPTIKFFNRKLYSIDSFSNSEEIYPFAHLFNGALISMDAVRKIGNINKDYFIMGDEVDYFFRLKKAGYVGTLLQAIHYHPDVSFRPYSGVKIYYLLKNTIINHNKYFDYSLIRNLALIYVLLYRVYKRNGARYFLSTIFAKNFFFFKAIYAGTRNIISKDF